MADGADVMGEALQARLAASTDVEAVRRYSGVAKIPTSSPVRTRTASDP